MITLKHISKLVRHSFANRVKHESFEFAKQQTSDKTIRLLNVKRFYSHSSTRTNESTKKASSESTLAHNSLTIGKSKHLMRLIYSRVHPDLFTNFAQAQKQNENSLKILRNLIDSYSVPNRPNNISVQNNLVFYVKKPKENELLKFQINLKSTSMSIQDQIESIFNQFIDYLKLPVNKFYSNSKLNSNQTKSSYNYTVSFYNRNSFDYDDDYVDLEEFERWTKENEKKYRIPTLKEWLNQNKTLIESKLLETKEMEEQIEKNKNYIIKKWALKDIIFNSNWSPRNFNSYLLSIKSFSDYIGDTNFEDLILVLTNDTNGLKKNGEIHLNCERTYEEWFNILAKSKKQSVLLNENKLMEKNLSKLLRHIKICDNLYMSSFQINDASYYNKLLNIVLNNLTQKIKSDCAFVESSEFSNLQLTVQNVNTLELNSSGQFVMGISNRINYAKTIDFIIRNKNKSIELYNDYVRSVEENRKRKESLAIQLKTKSIEFSHGLNFDQQLKCMQSLLNYSRKNESNMFELSLLNNTNLIIGYMYRLNNNGSITIPWNWYENEN